LDVITKIFEDINESVLKDFTREFLLLRNVSIGNINVSFQQPLAAEKKSSRYTFVQPVKQKFKALILKFQDP